MQVVPTSLVRITRFYMLAAIGYLLLTLIVGVLRVTLGLPDGRIHWVPAVLGWVSFPIMGAYYQFFPTLQGHDLRHERFALPQFALVNIGVIGMFAAALLGQSAAFAVWAILYGVGALLFLVVILGNLDPRQINLTLRFYLASLAYFAAGVLLFVLTVLGIAPFWANRALLLHLFVFGWAVMAIMGAEYSMVPMLQLKELREPRLAAGQFFAVNLGVVGLALGFASQQRLLIAGGGAFLMIAIGLFAYVIATSLLTGPSRLPKLDLSVRFFVVGIGYMVLTALAGTLMGAFGWYWLAPIHLHLGVIGLITNTIVGAMYHILPFVVWWEVYAPRLGTEEVPLLKHLFDERRADRQFYGLNVGVLLMVGGFASGLVPFLAAGGLILIATSLDFVHQMLGVVAHRRLLHSSRKGYSGY